MLNIQSFGLFLSLSYIQVMSMPQFVYILLVDGHMTYSQF